jgi:hypothetical protein
MAQFTWQDLQDASVATSLVWVISDKGEWTREAHEVRDLNELTLEEHLAKLEFTVMAKRAIACDGDRVTVPWVWRRLGKWHGEYLIHVYMSEGVVETVIAPNMPAYLHLMRQLRQAGLA